MTIGEKIKKYRLKKKLSQKQLAVMTGMSEPAIRNYELGNRTPSDVQLKKIAGALGISIFSLSDPDFDSYYGVMHSLFALEEMYGLHAEVVDGMLCLRFDGKGMSSAHIAEDVESWAKTYQKYRDGEVSQEYYEEWKTTYPKRLAQENKVKIQDKQKGK